MAVEGKWTLRVCACTVATVLDRGPALPTPCDGDAVERVAMHLYGDFEAESVPWSSLPGPEKQLCRDDAEAVLRAAGGQ